MCPDAQLESPHFYSQQGKGKERGLRAYAKKKELLRLKFCFQLLSEEMFTDSPQKENTGKLYIYTATMHNLKWKKWAASLALWQCNLQTSCNCFNIISNCK